VTDGRRQRCLALAALLTTTAALPASAQVTDTGLSVSPPGLSVTPALGVAEFWDDNPTLAGDGNPRTPASVTAVRPTMTVGYRGRRTTVRSHYAGSFDFYRDEPQLDTRDHSGTIDVAHQLTRRVQLFAFDQASLSPTTGDALQFGANVLRRQTTRLNAFRGGVDAALSARTTLKATYETNWIDFTTLEDTPALNLQLQSGHSHGGTGELRHRLSQRLTLGADYGLQRAIIDGGAETFDVQSALVVTRFALSPTATASVAYGHAWLTVDDAFRDSGPAFDLGLEWEGRRFGGSLGYERSFLPSFGFGGTFQNEALSATVRATLSRWVTWSAAVTVSDNDPLEAGDPTLRAVSAQTSFGWVVKRRLRLEVFGQHLSQDSTAPGGNVARTRAGVQASVFDTVRAFR
jgi:hypothetical protein